MFRLMPAGCEGLSAAFQQLSRFAVVGALVVQRHYLIEKLAGGRVIAGLADNCKNAFAFRSRHARDTGRTFAREGLVIEFSFAGDDDVGSRDSLAQIDEVGDDLEAGSDGRATKGEQPIAQAAGRPCARFLRDDRDQR